MWFFKKKKEQIPVGPPILDLSFLGVDMHSHLLPGVDDGAKTLEESVALIRGLKDKGYHRLITSPHVHVEFYNNRIGDLKDRFAQLQEDLKPHHLNVEMGLGAEYFLDEFFLPEIFPQGLLNFGNKQVLVEVSMAGWPRQFDDMLFTILNAGYNPILAHPERYQYELNLDVYAQLKEKGMTLQLNLLSIMGYYGKGVKDLAIQMLDAGLYDYCGTDTHHERHLININALFEHHQPILQRLADYGFKNESLNL